MKTRYFSTLVLFFCCFFVTTTPLLAQDSKIPEYYNSGDYDKCFKLCSNALTKNATDLEALLYSAMVWTKRAELNPEDKGYQSSYENASEEALKKLASLAKTDRTKTYINAHLEGFNYVRAHLLAKADYYASTDEIEKALTLYTNIMNKLQDMRVHFYVGCSWIKYNSPELGMNYLKKGLIEYIRPFKASGQKPESGFLEKLLEAAETLAERQGFIHSLKTFEAVDLLYNRAEYPLINDVYFRCLTISLTNIKVDNPQIFNVFKEYESALKLFPKEAKVQDLKAVFISNCLNSFTDKYSQVEDELANLEKCYRYLLDSTSNQAATFLLINKAMLPIIYSVYQVEQYQDIPSKSLQLYDVFCAINNDYDKQSPAFQKCLNYGFAANSTNKKNDILIQATALLIYKTKQKDLKVVTSKMKELETQVVSRVSKFGTSDEEFDELVYWLNYFPEFVLLKKSIQDYFISKATTLIDKNEFSKAGLFLFQAQKYFPEVSDFKKLKKICVEKDYKLNYVGSNFGNDVLKWTGSVEGCNPGEISAIAQEKIIQRYNFIRRLSNFPDGTILNPKENSDCQAGALCMRAEGKLSHNPDESWKCYSKAAARGAHNSLGFGAEGAECIPQMIGDDGSNNAATGHRGNLLTPRAKGFVYGATDQTVALSADFSKVHSDSVLKRFDTEFITWPPRGPVPIDLLFNRWSFKPYDNDFRFENVVISMKLDGKPIEVEMEYETDFKIGWIPNGIDKWSKKEQLIHVLIQADVRYDYNGAFTKKSFEYDVLILPIE